MWPSGGNGGGWRVIGYSGEWSEVLWWDAVTEVAEHTGACDLRQSSSVGRAASESSSSRSGSGSGGLKYGSGDTLSDFVTFVCEETRKTQRLVSLLSLIFDTLKDAT